MELSMIKDTIMQVAEAITAALEIETEIVDHQLEIIGGTGRYLEKIGCYEEGGNRNSGLIYGTLLNSGQVYICKNCPQDPIYHATEGELSEICCPITLDGKVLGLIGLVAFDESQREKMMDKSDNLLIFLERMAELIASKLVMTSSRDKLKSQLDSILQGPGTATTFEDIIGKSRELEVVKRRGLQVATSDSTVLIRGESGCGKELFARAIHFASHRKEESFISVNCGAIPEMLLESELFGYEGGAFTGAEKKGKPGKFELAHNGTIFLDEIGDMPLHLQVKLLSAIQNRRIDKVGGLKPVDINVRIIAATNKNLEEMIETKQFREDLYFRLNVIPLDVPSLRQRPEDIETLLEYSLGKFNRLLNKNIVGFQIDTKNVLQKYDWPGNVRELENVVEYVVNMEETDRVQMKNLPDRIKMKPNEMQRGATLKEKTDACQRQAIEECLKWTGHSLEGKRQAAQRLGISESTLYRRIKELNMW